MSIELKYNYLPISELLRNIDHEEIYSMYLKEEIRPDKLVKCCFHKDNSPSLGFYKTEAGNIRYNCFGCGAQGGVIDFVQNMFNISFEEASMKIQHDLGNFNALERISVTNNINTFDYKESVSERLKIIPIERSFNDIDYNYWNSYGLELIDVYNGGIEPCSRVYYNNKNKGTKLLCYHEDSNPIYRIKLNKGIYKIYRPLNPTKSGKWFANSGSEDIQGINLISEHRDILFITSSMKDVLVLRKIGYDAIAPNGEGVRIPDKIIDYLVATSNNILYFNDSDEAGYNYTEKMSKETGFKSIFIPEKYKVKDISDFVKENNIVEAKELVKTLIKEAGFDDNDDGGGKESRVI